MNTTEHGTTANASRDYILGKYSVSHEILVAAVPVFVNYVIMIDLSNTQRIIELLKRKKIRLSSGLTDSEINNVQHAFEFQFPPDYRCLLQTALPISSGFYNWRKALKYNVIAKSIHEMMEWPLDGILYDIENNSFWVSHELPGIPSWGCKPESLTEQFEIARKHYIKYPKLIPIFGHRFIPETPHENGNPIFSVYQTDIIYYGGDLKNYFFNELDRDRNLSDFIKHIPFWSDMCNGEFES